MPISNRLRIVSHTTRIQAPAFLHRPLGKRSELHVRTKPDLPTHWLLLSITRQNGQSLPIALK
jgi:hypothetical protein